MVLEANPKSPVPEESPDVDLPSPARGKVLIVDDELAVVRMFSRALSDQGFQVLSATDGQTAQAMFEEAKVDAVVSDVSMPGMDGLTLMRALRQIDGDVPVILATGNRGDEISRQAVAEGALMCFVKPVDLRALTQAVTHAAQLHRAAFLMRAAREEAGPSAAPFHDLGAAFERALARLWVAYQPIVQWNTLHVVGYEALARSDEPALSTPGALFEAAEKLGRVTELGRAVRGLVAAGIPEAPAHVRIFVNVHGAEMLAEPLYSPEDPLAPWAKRVVLEITERSPLDQIPDVNRRVERLRAAGYQIAVDDLGAGYAGLSSFAQLHPSVVKLDMSLVRGIDQSPIKCRIVQTIAALCADSGVDLIGEGVETNEERWALGLHGCQLHQGYAYASPQRGFARSLR